MRGVTSSNLQPSDPFGFTALSVARKYIEESDESADGFSRSGTELGPVVVETNPMHIIVLPSRQAW